MSVLPENHRICPICGEVKNIFFPNGPMPVNKDILELDAKCYNCYWVGKVGDLVGSDKIVYNLEETPKGQRCVCKQES